VAPAPVPPSPQPVDPADAALWAVAGPWTKLRHTGETHRVAVALQTWATTEGLS
jgi:hypothetical protein